MDCCTLGGKAKGEYAGNARALRQAAYVGKHAVHCNSGECDTVRLAGGDGMYGMVECVCVYACVISDQLRQLCIAC
jgi:hypothetical protein